MIDAYLKLGLAALLPPLAAVLLYLVTKLTPFGRVNRHVRAVIYGVIFGGLAILGTEWGIPINGAQVNCRDAAVLAAGLLFGAPAGIIAGMIGAVERWIAVAWGIGSFTRVACTVSTLLAGFYAAALRVYLFEDKKPGWGIAFAIGTVMEVFHLTMVFITNMTTPEQAMAVVKACTIPMVIANSVSVFLSAFFVSLLAREPVFARGERRRISQTVQRWLFITVLLAFAVTSCFVFLLQDAIAVRQIDEELELALQEVTADIRDASDRNLLKMTRRIAECYDQYYLPYLAGQYGIAEINVVDRFGVIADSTEPRFIGFDMHSGEQSAAFLCLLEGEEEYVQDYGPISYDTTLHRKYAGVRTETGFVQVGYNAEGFQKDIDAQVIGLTQNRHVGKTGFIYIMDATGRIVSAPTGADPAVLTAALPAELLPEAGVTTAVVLDGADCYCRCCPAEGYRIVSLLPKAEATEMRDIALYVNTFMEILVFAVLFGLIYQLIKTVVVKQIKRINRSLAKITQGQLDEVVSVRSNEEFASLSDDINSTVDTLKHYIAEASARIDAELEFAKSIQSSALPSVFPAFPKRRDFDIYASMDPAKEVGGDFYDFYMTGSDTLHFLVADVSGKGIPAAMFMMRAKTELKSLTEAELPLAEVFTRGNAALCEGNDAGMFVTAWQGSIDLTSGRVQFANAGHNPPLVKRGDAPFTCLRTRAGFVLAGMDGMRYRPQELELAPGDIIFLYTDGVTEATNAESELFGEDRLLEAVNSQAFEDMQTLCRSVRAAVDDFVGEAPQFDDITMVALRYIGTPPAPEIRFDAATIEDIPAATAFVEELLEKLDCPMKTVIQINIAIDEIFSNIVKYGYPKQPGPVTLRFRALEDPAAVALTFIDEGIPYNPLNVADPDITLSAEERGIGGLGIYMVKKSMDEMRYLYENDQNVLTIRKNL